MMNDAAVHMVMGADEAHVIHTALQVLLDKIDFDLERVPDESEEDRAEYLAMLSIKLCAEGMAENIAGLFDNDDYGDDDE